MLPTSEQTIGPFFPAGFFGPADHDLTRLSAEAAPSTRGVPILLRGRVLRQDDVACVNAVLEAWQADAAGRFAARDADADPDFLGWGRCCTDAEGRYAFRSLLPGGFADETGTRAPQVNLTVLGSGLMRRLLTTAFFPGFEAALAEDPVWRALPQSLRPLLLAEEAPAEAGLRVFRFDIRLRGPAALETPFFEL
jgi:protocatechuate 3,4-dioxygenase alpha subunit